MSAPGGYPGPVPTLTAAADSAPCARCSSRRARRAVRAAARHEDERHRMVGRELAGPDRVWLAMPAGTVPAVDRDVGLDRPLRQPSPGDRPPHRMVGRAPEAVGEARTTAAVAAALVRRRPAAGAVVEPRSPDRRRRGSVPSTIRQPRAAARGGGARSVRLAARRWLARRGPGARAGRGGSRRRRRDRARR